ncbi:polymorphic toxin-type HINT domain-containing protein [Streptomyces sp. NRRL B-24484]|uniref:polymorphic toxin-type HINT domain-containing protein n=1 Tax=Streptomyces sp. NRRL B-24484 TaxID=1463833 RepID=UPI0013313ADB|nr:polymorphic toxin-type HINT domain-containing protein [Streptomyces sp. NRRL B-24484]
MAGLLAVPAAADTAPAAGPVADRVTAVAAWKDGGPAVKRAAETALAGSDADVHAFVSSGRTAAAEQDLRSRVEELIAVSGPGVREAATKALAGSAADLQKFMDSGFRRPFEDDQRVLATQIMSNGGPGVRAAANKALDGTIDDVNAFLNTAQYTARDDDDHVKATQLLSTGGPEVRKAANIALDGSIDDVREFLRYGYQTAAAHDQETLTVAQLADLTKNASSRAGEQAKTAKDAAAKAVEATALAKQAAERAAAETKAAQGEAGKASNAAGRAADAAERAAKAARQASDAAAAANEAARQAASAAADAAKASELAGAAATAARSAAGKAADDASKAEIAKQAAVAARDAARYAGSAGEAAAWAGRAASQAKLATQAAKSAGDNADAAAAAALEASNQSGVTGEAADRARQAADRAKAASAEAKRAANAVAKISADAEAAAGDAKRASDASAAHAAAAAAAADAAAQHAGDAASSTATAQAAATEAAAAADTAADTATQAHKVADIARASDQERLAAQQAAEVAKAQEAYFEEARKAKAAAWESGKATAFAADTERLITEATAAGVEQSTAVAKGRQAAVRLLTTGGPWLQSAAQAALEGHDGDVLAFLNTDLPLARERDDRASVLALAQGSTKLEQRLAAETAAVGTVEQVRAFLATGAYPGKDDDDRVRATQIMSTGGPGVRAAANKALNGTIEDVRAFLATGQYAARNDDNRVLITQAMSTGGPEVKAAAQAVLSGPASGLEPFLTVGLPKARQRDAFTAAHVATVSAYLQAIDGNVALARKYAAEAAQSYATARGAASEAAGYANQAQTSATQAADWAAKAAESARQAQASATQAAGYAKQARTAAASAEAAARSADVSASAAAGYARQARQDASDAKTYADQARNSAIAAGKSAEEARQAADQAWAEVWKNRQVTTDEGKMQSQTAVVDDNGRVSFVMVVQRPDMKQDYVEHGTNCVEYDPEFMAVLLSNWKEGKDGHLYCDQPVTVTVSGTVDYYLKTCPEPNLTIAACQGKYSTWDTILLDTRTLSNEHYETTVEKQYKSTRQFILEAITSDFVKCWNNPGLNGPCAWAASNFIPYGTLAKGAKAVVAFRYALETGVALEDAKLALQASLEGFKDATVGKLLATADAIAAFRLTLKDGKGVDESLAALRKNPSIAPETLRQLETEKKLTDVIRASCPTGNSFPAGTKVLMADGTARAIETVRVGDLVLAADPLTGARGPRAVTATIYTPDDRDFAELTVTHGDGTSGKITATAHHPFWVRSTATWTDAANIRPGDTLRTDAGDAVAVSSVRKWSGLEAAYNLTVDELHTYHVMAGTTAVLVHNSGSACPLIGVPAAAFDRVMARLSNLRIGDKRIVFSVEAFGSRAGSTFRRPDGPTPDSDLDLLATIDPAELTGRNQAWIDQTIQSIKDDFKAETGITLSLHYPDNVTMFRKSIEGAEYLPIPLG